MHLTRLKPVARMQITFQCQMSTKMKIYKNQIWILN